MNIAASGMMAQRTRMNVISNNIANTETAFNVNGERVPYRRKEVLFAPEKGGNNDPEGVQVMDVQDDQSPFRKEYKPGHPAANEEGYVKMPNVNPVVEMVDMKSATRAYEANSMVVQASKSMAERSLQILA